MSKSLYAILNVAPDADPAVIEAAYRALMKKYHPDVGPGGPAERVGRAAEINEAFQILRDPERRASYDEELRARRDALRPPTAPIQPTQWRQPKPLRRRHKRAPIYIAVGAVLLLGLFVWRQSEATGLDLRSLLMSYHAKAAAETRQAPAPDLTAPVSVADVDRAVAEYRKIRERSGLLGLATSSEDCFSGQSRSRRVEDFDFCVAFDHAAATYDTDLAGVYSLPKIPRFEAERLNARHLALGRLLSGDDNAVAARLTTIKSMTEQKLRGPEQPKPAAAAAKAQLRRETRSARTARAARPKPSQPQRREGDFLEREGYIY